MVICGSCLNRRPPSLCLTAPKMSSMPLRLLFDTDSHSPRLLSGSPPQYRQTVWSRGSGDWARGHKANRPAFFFPSESLHYLALPDLPTKTNKAKATRSLVASAAGHSSREIGYLCYRDQDYRSSREPPWGLAKTLFLSLPWSYLIFTPSLGGWVTLWTDEITKTQEGEITCLG